MFDGNYRTQRRAVNLSGKRKTETASGKQAVLEQARCRREERRRVAAEHQAATTLQRWLRGCLQRQTVAQQWRLELHHQLNSIMTAMDTTTSTMKDDCVTPMLDAWLGLKTINAAASKKNEQEILSLLQQYAIWLERASSKLLQQKDPPTGHRIISTLLQYLQNSTMTTTWTRQQILLVLSYCLNVPLDPEGDARNRATRHAAVTRTNNSDRTKI